MFRTVHDTIASTHIAVIIIFYLFFLSSLGFVILFSEISHWICPNINPSAPWGMTQGLGYLDLSPTQPLFVIKSLLQSYVCCVLKAYEALLLSVCPIPWPTVPSSIHHSEIPFNSTTFPVPTFEYYKRYVRETQRFVPVYIQGY